MSDAPRKELSKPLSIRFTDTEKARLKELAGATPLGIFIRERALGSETAPRTRVTHPVKDGEPLGRLLALLGQSRLANNLNELAKAANQGSLPVTEETEADIRAACAQIFEMRLMLLRALGLKILGEVNYATPLPELFAEAAGGREQ
jgi:hypothetical protein